jgi:hypothetical protein
VTGTCGVQACYHRNNLPFVERYSNPSFSNMNVSTLQTGVQDKSDEKATHTIQEEVMCLIL